MSFKVLIHPGGYLDFDVSSPIDYDLINRSRNDAGAKLRKLLGTRVALDEKDAAYLKRKAAMSSWAACLLETLLFIVTVGLSALIPTSVCFPDEWPRVKKNARQMLQTEILECGLRPSDFTFVEIMEGGELWEVFLNIQSSAFVDASKVAEINALKRQEREAEDQAKRQFIYMGQCDAHGMIGMGSVAHNSGMASWNKGVALRERREELQQQVRAGRIGQVAPQDAVYSSTTARVAPNPSVPTPPPPLPPPPPIRSVSDPILLGDVTQTIESSTSYSTASPPPPPPPPARPAPIVEDHLLPGGSREVTKTPVPADGSKTSGWNTLSCSSNASATVSKIAITGEMAVVPNTSDPQIGTAAGVHIRTVVLPRTDPSNPKSSFGLKLEVNTETGSATVRESHMGHMIQKGDVVVSVNGILVYYVATNATKVSFYDVVEMIQATAEGESLVLELLRPASSI